MAKSCIFIPKKPLETHHKIQKTNETAELVVSDHTIFLIMDSNLNKETGIVCKFKYIPMTVN